MYRLARRASTDSPVYEPEETYYIDFETAQRFFWEEVVERETSPDLVVLTRDQDGRIWKFEDVFRTRGYAAIGRWRAWCGHVHRTIEAAWKCQQKDVTRCRNFCSESDRAVYGVVVPKGRQIGDWRKRPLTEMELAEIGRL